MCGIGLYMDTLDLEANLGNWTFTAGKYEPNFGFAWDITFGPWGSRYAEDYELTERMALGAAYTFNTSFGKHTLAVNTFFADTTIFSESSRLEMLPVVSINAPSLLSPRSARAAPAKPGSPC